LIQSVGEAKFLQYIGKGKQLWIDGMKSSDRIADIRIIGSEYRCEIPRVLVQSDYIYRPISVIPDSSYRSCHFEEQKQMHVNTVNNQQFSLFSEKKQEMIFRIFPIDPYKYKY